MTPLSAKERLCGLLGIFCFVLLSYPFVQIFNRDTLVGGIPLLALYFFWVWIWAIVALLILSRWLTCQIQPGQKETKRDAE